MTFTLGTSAGETLLGGTDEDTIFGQSGNDTLEGVGGSDVVYGGDGDDLIFADENTGGLPDTSLREFVDAGAGKDVVQVALGAQHTVMGGAGDDVVEVVGDFTTDLNDVLDGGLGLDTLDMAALTDNIYIELGEFGQFGQVTIGDRGVLAGFEIIYTGSGEDDIKVTNDYTSSGIGPGFLIYGGGGLDDVDLLTGNNTVHGGEDRDLIDSYVGNDVIYGEDGDDLISLQVSVGDIEVYGGTGADTFYLIDYDLANGAASQNFADGGDEDDLVDQFWLEADLGMTGVLDLRSGKLLLSDGVSTMKVKLAGFENFFLDAEDDTVFGNAGQVTVKGDQGNDTLTNEGDRSEFYGGAGDDVLIGGDRVRSYLYGNDGNDTLTTGLKKADKAYGGEGDDTVFVTMSDGYATKDSLAGGSGVDVLDWSLSTRSNMVIDLAAQTATDGIVTVSVKGFEHVTGSALADTLVGTDGGNEMRGGDGADSLRGADGDDRLYAGTGSGAGTEYLLGGFGNDTLYGEGSSIATLFFAAEGDDVVFAGSALVRDDGFYGGIGVDSIALGQVAGAVNAALGLSGSLRVGAVTIDMDGFEILFGTDLGDTIAGDGLDNGLHGGLGDDMIAGAAGADVLDGGDGNDVLSGGSEADTLEGGAQDDRLTGGTGADSLTGGDGADRFVFASALDAGATLGLRDVVTDFVSGVDDLDLSGIAGLTWINTAAFTGVAMQGRQVASGGNTFVYVDADGDRVADMQIFLSGLTGGLVAGDVIL